MPAPIKLDDEYGYLTFEFAAPIDSTTPGDPPVVPGRVRLDVYETNAAYVALYQRVTATDPAADVTVPWRDHLYTLGFPPMSWANANYVVRAVQAAIDRLGKADGDSTKRD